MRIISKIICIMSLMGMAPAYAQAFVESPQDTKAQILLRMKAKEEQVIRLDVNYLLSVLVESYRIAPSGKVEGGMVTFDRELHPQALAIVEDLYRKKGWDFSCTYSNESGDYHIVVTEKE